MKTANRAILAFSLGLAGLVGSGCGGDPPVAPVGESYRLEWRPQGISYSLYPELGVVLARPQDSTNRFDYYLYGNIESLDTLIDLKNPRYFVKLFKGAEAVATGASFRSDTAAIGHPIDSTNIPNGLKSQHILHPHEEAYFLVRAPITWTGKDTVYYDPDVDWDQSYVWVSDKDPSHILPYSKSDPSVKKTVLRVIGGPNPRAELVERPSGKLLEEKRIVVK
jgi:hypothetical protein